LTARRSPPPWPLREIAARFIIEDTAGQAPAYVYFEEESGQRTAAHLLTRDEARRIAANIAELPELVRIGRNDPRWRLHGARRDWLIQVSVSMSCDARRQASPSCRNCCGGHVRRNKIRRFTDCPRNVRLCSNCGSVAASRKTAANGMVRPCSCPASD
jgi:hypothetical protein